MLESLWGVLPVWAHWVVAIIAVTGNIGFAVSEYLSSNPNVKPNGVVDWVQLLLTAGAPEAKEVEGLITGQETTAFVASAELTAVKAKLAALNGGK